MTQPSPQRVVSTWSLHRTLGGFVAEDSALGGGPFFPRPEKTSGLTLLELIPELAVRGYEAVQICHFHLASREQAYLHSVRSALDLHGIVLDALLIDDGDLTAEDIDPQLDWYNSWLDDAQALGATRARISAGRSHPTPELLHRSGGLLAQLASDHPDVRIVTENWMELTPDAGSLLTVLDIAGDSVGLLIDLGNWDMPEKYDQLAMIAHRAETCHAKCVCMDGGPDEADFRRTLGILKDAGFNGPLALIYDGPDADEWAGLELERNIVEDVFR